MPRQARIDAPTAIHHIIVRGIEKRKIFKDIKDRDNFLERMGHILSETQTPCFAWALMDNHVHLLLRTGHVPIATVMRRLLTGHAIYFNRRYKRHGHLFQNRYKSILCEEDPYLKELVRYIHLNPLRAGLVKDLKSLDSYPYSGHKALLVNEGYEWQDIDYILGFFGNQTRSARRYYSAFIAEGINTGRRPELVGGGLLRSVGGWRALKDYYNEGIRIKGDERILGSSDFVEGVLKRAEEELKLKYRLHSEVPSLDEFIEKVGRYLNVPPDLIRSPLKQKEVVQARTVYCYLAVIRLKYSCTSVAQSLNLSTSTVSRTLKRWGDIPLKENIEKSLLGTE